ncbi:winged helix-turn-helix domain-containing protein [Limosilactobacillus caecicola]|uniref:winged helix-turn-helix domain-containing protein n=1 Tax=Limosilactobacillus caecicola TaxID=2941332 RepID=UPI00203B999C|nr:response regulator transcription factor [Limosilactobacillus caecicola]
MPKYFLVMSQNLPLVAKLQKLAHQLGGHVSQLTTPTGLVVALEHHQIAGVWWDLDDVTLDTTTATMTLVRHLITGPVTVFASQPSERQIRKLYQAKVDDVVTLPFNETIYGAMFSQRLRTYQEIPARHQGDTSQATENNAMIGDWQINQDDYTVIKNGAKINLTPKEFQLLTFLNDHHGHVLSREQLVNGVWGYDLLESSRIVDIHISHLRDKLEDQPSKPVHLLTVRGFGYKLV